MFGWKAETTLEETLLSAWAWEKRVHELHEFARMNNWFGFAGNLGYGRQVVSAAKKKRTTAAMQRKGSPPLSTVLLR